MDTTADQIQLHSLQWIDNFPRTVLDIVATVFLVVGQKQFDFTFKERERGNLLSKYLYKENGQTVATFMRMSIEKNQFKTLKSLKFFSIRMTFFAWQCNKMNNFERFFENFNKTSTIY